MGTHVLEEYRPNNYTCVVCPYTCIQNTHRYTMHAPNTGHSTWPRVLNGTHKI